MGISLTLPDNKITVITGKNGSGKTRLLEQIKSGMTNLNDNLKCVILDSDSHNNLNEDALKNFVSYIKEKSKHNPFIIASMTPEVIEAADILITLKNN